MSIIYILAALGAYRVVRRIVIIVRWERKTRHWTIPPWLGGPRGGMRGIHP